MNNRRSFLKKSALSLLALSLPSSADSLVRTAGRLSPMEPESAAVIWYSQTGNTERTGRLIAETLKKRMPWVDAFEYRQLPGNDLSSYDLVIVGSPVYYYEVPENFRSWIRSASGLEGKPVSAYVTFGGRGGNQHNAVCTLLEHLVGRGGLPVSMNGFGNMSTFAITWSSGNENQVLKYRDLPSEMTYASIREFALHTLQQVRSGATVEISRYCDFREWIKGAPSIWGTKLLIDRHAIDERACTGCGLCRALCPTGAIDTEVDTDRCIVCLGCVNNCPAGAVDMTFMGKKIYGYHEFLRRQKLRVIPPAEFRKS